jgi:CubicO group peptidase (beta-lactamase class C family)
MVGAATDLSGLWKAQRHAGGLDHVRLLVTRGEEGFRADMLGATLPIAVVDGKLAFALAEGGSFRGALDKGGAIAGHWFFNQSASPVTLSPSGPGRWSGTVTTAPDELTFFLHLKAEDADTWTAVLRNPERDFGSLWRVSKLVRTDGKLELLGQDGGKETAVGAGSFDAESGRITLSLGGRGSFDFRREGEDSAFYPRGKVASKYAYRPPPALDDGWPTSTLAAVDVDRAGIEKAIQSILEMPMDSLDAPQYDAVLVARHGKLVLEEYFHGEHRDRLHNIRSAGKSVTSVLVGAVLKDGAPLSLSSSVDQVMGAGAPGMTLEHLLTMSSGLFCDDTNDQAPGNEDKIWAAQDQNPDFYKVTLQVPLATPPGEKSVYCSMQPNLALGMVGRATKDFPLVAFDRLVAKPMRLGAYAWALDAAGNAYGGGGLMLLPRDFLKFGELMLREGAWNGRQIVGRDYARRSISSLYHLRRITYGYLWWVEDLPYKDRTVRAFMALGNGGNNIVGIPELDLVVAIYGANYGSRTTGKIREIIPRLILPTVDARAPVVEHEYTNPYGRSDDGSRVR